MEHQGSHIEHDISLTYFSHKSRNTNVYQSRQLVHGESSSSIVVLTAEVLDGAVHDDVGRENSHGDAKARKGTLVAPRYHRVLSPCILPGKHHPILCPFLCLENSSLHSVAAPSDAVLARKAPLWSQQEFG